MKDEMFEEALMIHGYPESGPGSVFIETLYQTFKQRLLRELVAKSPGHVFEINGVRLGGAPLKDDSAALGEAFAAAEYA